MNIAIYHLNHELGRYKDTIKEMRMEKEKSLDESEKRFLDSRLIVLTYTYNELEKAIKYLEGYEK